MPTEPPQLVPKIEQEASAPATGMRPSMEPGRSAEISDREHLANIAQMRKLMGVGAAVTLFFASFDILGLNLGHIEAIPGAWVPRALIAVPALIIWYRLRRQPPVTPMWLATANMGFFVWATIQTVILCAQSNGFASPVLEALVLILIGQTFLQPVPYLKGILQQGTTIGTFLIGMLIAAGIRPDMAAQLRSDEIRGAFISKMIAVMTAWVLLVLGGHSFWDTRRKFIETRTAGRYILKKRIASGGMGEVWSAYHPAMKREVAVKILRQDCMSPGLVSRFEREITAMTLLSHPNTVRVLDCGTTNDGLVYYVMELIKGETLKQLVEREGPLPAARAIHIARQATRALAEAHANGIVHRDIKPSNLLITSSGGEKDFVKVVDFGVAKHGVVSPEETELTNVGVVVGTPAYMSPEQAAAGEVDARTDLYALGAVVFFALTGRPPFQGPQAALLEAHRTEVAPLLSACSPHRVPPALDKVVRTCLAKDKALRFASALELDIAFAELLVADEDEAPWSPLQLPPVSSPPISQVDRDRATVRPGSAEEPSARDRMVLFIPSEPPISGKIPRHSDTPGANSSRRNEGTSLPPTVRAQQ